jgi:hypothetical protein
VYVRGMDSGVDYWSFFLMKIAFDKDKKYAAENLKNFEDFDEHHPVI